MSATKKKHLCEVCGKKITQQEYLDYDGMCWECWEDQLSEESEDTLRNFLRFSLNYKV